MVFFPGKDSIVDLAATSKAAVDTIRTVREVRVVYLLLKSCFTDYEDTDLPSHMVDPRIIELEILAQLAHYNYTIPWLVLNSLKPVNLVRGE